MSMITELVQELREKAFFRTADNVYNLLDKAADTIEELSAKLQSANIDRSSQYYNGGWILCEERLPETNIIQCLVCLENESIFMAWFNGVEFKEISTFGTKSFYEENKLVAWMPLPEPYKPQKD